MGKHTLPLTDAAERSAIGYQLWPTFPVPAGEIDTGYDALVTKLVEQRRVTIDGYGGVLWSDLRRRLDAALLRRGVCATWHDVEVALRPTQEIDELVSPSLGDDDPVFGHRFTGELRDFFDQARLQSLRSEAGTGLSIVYGTGAALVDSEGYVVYVDLPKDEIQRRSRRGTIRNLGAGRAGDAKTMYKRCYFVDWVALNRHKADLLPTIDLFVDGTRFDEPTMMAGDHVRTALTRASRTCFRVRPWFEPGAWGGQWLKKRIPGLPQDVPNYAWSFELITPENGLVLDSDGRRLEISFDCLMYHDHEAVLGSAAARFGFDFPIRFDFLDTFAGGNLSVQCHPSPAYIRDHFGEPFTQDETYYILDCRPGAKVYVGFQDGVDPEEFRRVLDRSQTEGVPVDINRYVHSEPSRKHELFLIPHGTVHSAGVDNLVLEISATPYIFTFKMYDWLRADLNGQPRPLNVKRAWDNLDFSRQRSYVREHLIAQPRLIAAGSDWRVEHLPTHSIHFYDVHRFTFGTEVEASTGGSCHVLSVVDGEAVTVETGLGMRQRFHYAETFVVPAAATRYRLINEGSGPVQVVKAFVKPGAV